MSSDPTDHDFTNLNAVLNRHAQDRTPETGVAIKLITGRTDQEIVDDLRKRVIEAYKPLLALCTEANHNGFGLNITIGPDAFGNFTIQHCQIIKVYK